jgi:predicted nucleotidyltransferase component of viral defense system
MAASEPYRRQVSLLVQVLPFVAEENYFALKGGTAINLFVRDMPRLSVDIDLTYLPIADREKSLADIDAAMKRIAEQISASLPRSRVQTGQSEGSIAVTKLNVRTPDAQVKLEVTPVLCGCVFEPETRTVSARVEDEFGFAEIQLVSFADLYAGKIVAALDRQHPRDLFDVRDLLANEGIDDSLRKAFIVYVLSHNRPMAEVLAPTRKNIAQEFKRGFIGMTETPVSLGQLIDTRERLIVEVVDRMPQAHRNMLISFKAGRPDWSLLDVPNAENLPAIRWRMENLARLDSARHSELLESLKGVLRAS